MLKTTGSPDVPASGGTTAAGQPLVGTTAAGQPLVGTTAAGQPLGGMTATVRSLDLVLVVVVVSHLTAGYDWIIRSVDP